MMYIYVRNLYASHPQGAEHIVLVVPTIAMPVSSSTAGKSPKRIGRCSLDIFDFTYIYIYVFILYIYVYICIYIYILYVLYVIGSEDNTRYVYYVYMWYWCVQNFGPRALMLGKGSKNTRNKWGFFTRKMRIFGGDVLASFMVLGFYKIPNMVFNSFNPNYPIGILQSLYWYRTISCSSCFAQQNDAWRFRLWFRAPKCDMFFVPGSCFLDNWMKGQLKGRLCIYVKSM